MKTSIRRPHTAAKEAARSGSPRSKCSERGATTLEYAGVILLACLLVGAVITGISSTSIGTRIACAIDSIITGSSSCAPVTPVTVGHSPSDGNAAANPAAANASGSSNTSTSGTSDTPDRPAVDQNKVNNALKDVQAGIDGGWNGVGTGDLKKIEKALSGLNGAEVDAVIAGLSDEELQKWVKEMEEDGWFFGARGWSAQRRQEMWKEVLEDASYDTVRRLAEFSHDIQPKFDDIEHSGEYEGGPQYEEAPADSKPVIDGVSPEDISQGIVGDCWYIASLQAVAQADPSVIEDAITDNGNGTYTVRLYKDGKPVYITVTTDQVVGQAEGHEGERPFARATDPNEMWPPIMEKALAAYEGSYGAIESNHGYRGMEILTGKKSTKKTDISAQELKDALDDGQAVTAGSKAKPLRFRYVPWVDDNPDDYPDRLYNTNATDSNGDPLPEPLVYNHEYYVQSVDLGDPNDPSDDTVIVANPWGGTHEPMTLPFEDFKDGYSEFSFNPVH
ncbi:C2 family cysteine protease [Actinomyces succiniciruminis]|uniref:Eukaryotic thiol (Cysteine) proteases cysteine active site n=1 Tax=Actinomyces succiniciruminis TaxID=1522002 RepID=A0A1L7RLR7_9ACTO|nr:C2 family cysteine protease [Actinomyces succiniciruminis]CED90398.1 Eukaryotic thiol (cysteine) proteases cysteine active site [Actinomyces succiniciruminis]